MLGTNMHVRVLCAITWSGMSGLLNLIIGDVASGVEVLEGRMEEATALATIEGSRLPRGQAFTSDGQRCGARHTPFLSLDCDSPILSGLPRHGCVSS